MTKKSSISVSGIDTFAECPRKYKFNYVDRIYRKSNENFIFGTLGHKVMEFIGMGLEDDIILDYVKHSAQYSGAALALKTLKITNVEALVKTYIKEHRKFLEKYEVIQTEIKIRWKNLVGVIDLIAVEKGTGKLLILDYKFSNYAKSDTDISDNLQLYMYAHLLNHMKGIKKILKKYNIKTVYLGYFTLSKIELGMPKKLASGALSKAKDKRVTYETYLEAIELYGLNRTDYEGHLHKLSLQSNSAVSFIEMKLTTSELDEKIEEINSWVKLIEFAIKNNTFPGRNAFHCHNSGFRNDGCPIKNECKNHL